MTALKVPTPEEVHTAYEHGEAAVQSLVTGLVGVIRALEDQLAKNSRNSSKPPASDGLRKPSPKSLRQSSGKSSGGQPGHAPYHLEAVPTPQYTTVHRVTTCQSCQADLTDVPVSTCESGRCLTYRS